MQEIKQLLAITQQLKDRYKHLNKNFTLDGKLVGDIGEVLAAEKYDLELLPENEKTHDGIQRSTGHKVQIKSTMKGYFYFPFGENRIPDFFLCIHIQENGEFEEVYNGPGSHVVEEYIKKSNLKPYRNSYYTLSKNRLKELNNKVEQGQKLNQK